MPQRLAAKVTLLLMRVYLKVLQLCNLSFGADLSTRLRVSEVTLNNTNRVWWDSVLNLYQPSGSAQAPAKDSDDA